MTSEACAAHDESAKTQSIGENLEAPISLNPEQLESVAAGLSFTGVKGIIYGLILKPSFNPAANFGAQAQAQF